MMRQDRLTVIKDRLRVLFLNPSCKRLVRYDHTHTDGSVDNNKNIQDEENGATSDQFSRDGP